jgi:PleD family two-component response regulator
LRLFQQEEVLIWEEKAMSDQLSVPNPSQQVSVLVVDDADVIRKTLRNFLKEEPAIRLLGEASNFAEAISLTAALKWT